MVSDNKEEDSVVGGIASSMAELGSSSGRAVVTAASKEFLGRQGVSAHWLQNGLLQEVDTFCAESLSGTTATVYDIEPWLRQKSATITCPLDGRVGSSYVHALSASDKPEESSSIGPANYMLSYGWSYRVKDIVDTLVDFCTTNQLDPKTTYIWICSLCNNQHRVKEMQAQGKSVPFEDFQEIFYRNVTGSKNILAMMSPWQKPVYLERIWCIFELYTAHSNPDCNLTIIMPPQERAGLSQKLTEEGATAALNVLFETLAATKVQNATASEESDRAAILKLVKDNEESYNTLNHRVNDLLRDWALHVIKSLAQQAGDSQTEEAATKFQNIGMVLRDQGDYEGALVEYRKALEIGRA